MPFSYPQPTVVLNGYSLSLQSLDDKRKPLTHTDSQRRILSNAIQIVSLPLHQTYQLGLPTEHYLTLVWSSVAGYENPLQLYQHSAHSVLPLDSLTLP